MTDLIVDAREEKEAGNWPQAVTKCVKGCDLAEQWLTEFLLAKCGILLVEVKRGK